VTIGESFPPHFVIERVRCTGLELAVRQYCAKRTVLLAMRVMTKKLSRYQFRIDQQHQRNEGLDKIAGMKLEPTEQAVFDLVRERAPRGLRDFLLAR
jgi:hypothetical protein